MFYLLLFCALAVLICVSLFLEKKKGVAVLERIVKISSVCFIVLTMAGLFLPDFFACSHELPNLGKMTGTKLHAMVRWLNLVSFTVLPIAVFQKNKYFLGQKVIDLFF